jgi:hypothetical protein
LSFSILQNPKTVILYHYVFSNQPNCHYQPQSREGR